MHVKIKSRREKPEGFRKEGKNKQIVQLINVKILWKFNLLSCVPKTESICATKCYKAGEAYVDASNPMIAFAAGEDEFEIVEPDSSFRQKEYEFRGEQYYLVPEFYRNGWLALTLVMVEDEDEYIVLSVNLEEMDALGLPDRTFIDVNHYPEAMEFLVKNGLATDSEYKRRSGFVEYPMAMLNLPLLYQHNPQIFQKANIELFGEECF